LAAPLAPASNLHKLFETAISNRLKYPSVTLANAHYGPIVVKLAGDRSKHRGDCWVMDQGKYPNTTIFGRITRNGEYLRYMDGPNEQLQKLHAMIEQLIVEPVKTVIENASLTGYCCFCMQKLSDARSTNHGYGPICAKNYELPWDATRDTAGLHLEEKAVS
jgi:hypothetical protein